MMESPNFIFFGTPYVGRDTLAALLLAGYTPRAVVTAPAALRGRGMVLTPCETEVLAREHNLPLYTPEKITADTIQTLRSLGAEYAIVVAYGKILPKALINAFPKGVLNIHYSLLPAYRGASPVEAVLLNGDTETGVTIQKMVYALDAGDVLAQEVTKITQVETTRELRPRLIQLGAELLIRTLPSFLDGSLSGTPQDASEATHCGKIAKEDGLLILSPENALKNWRTYRAYAESPGTYFFAVKDGINARVKIHTATFQNAEFLPERIVPEGKKEMSFSDFSRNGWVPVDGM